MATICDVLGLSMADFLESAQNRPVREVKLTRSQSDFFAANPNHFNFYQKLSFERMTIQEIANAHRLNERSVLKYLRMLEEFQLIELHPGNRIKIQKFAKVQLDSPRLSQIHRESVAQFVRNLNRDSENNMLGTIHFKFKTTTRKRFKADILDLLERYFRQSELEQATTDRRDLEVLNVVTCYAEQSLSGDIPNI